MENTVNTSEMSKEELLNKCKNLVKIIHKYKQAKTDSDNEIENLKSKISKYESEETVCNEKIHTLQELVDSLTEQKLNYITEKDAAESKVKALTASCNNYELELNEHKAEIIVKNNTISEASTKLSNLDNEIVSLKRQNNRLLEENEQLINQLSEMEAKILEFNNIGLQQRQQLHLLEDKVNAGGSSDMASHEVKLKELNTLITSLENDLKTSQDNNTEIKDKLLSTETKLQEITTLYETEKDKKEKSNLKLKTYKDKILKCAACINQLKNSRYILSKTVKEYSDNIPKWQNDIIKASKFLDVQISGLNDEIKVLKERLDTMNKEYNHLIDRNSELNNDKKMLESKNVELSEIIKSAQHENSNSTLVENLHLQIKSLESEKSTLVKEKLNSRDHVAELENQVKTHTQVLENLKTENISLQNELENVKLRNKQLEENHTNTDAIDSLKNEIMTLKEMCELHRKENENLADMNNMLKEEVHSLKATLEQPNYDNENQSDHNMSLQADIVKLENKLSAYKQENSSLLIEVKENRNRLKEFESCQTEYEEIKQKIANYKSENAELLHEMKEINQVLKERGETISKQQKAITEMERLIETLEKDRDNINIEREAFESKCLQLESDLKNMKQQAAVDEISDKQNKDYMNIHKEISEKDALISSLQEEIEKLKQQQSSTVELPNEDMSTSTISKAEDHARMKDLDDTFEERYTKLRVFALKLKKKLKETTEQLQMVQDDKVKLEKLIIDNNTGNGDKTDTVPLSGAEMNKSENSSDNQAAMIELQNKLKLLTTELEAANKFKDEVTRLKAELSLKEDQLSSETDSHKATKELLEKTKKDVKKKSVLSLEIEDYERSVKELTNKMEEKKKKIIQMESTIDTQQGTINSMKTQIKLLEDQIKVEETQNRCVKEELQQALDDLKEKDSVVSTKNEIIIKLEINLEDQKRRFEEMNVEMTSLLGEKEKMIMSLCEDKVELNSKVKKLEFRCAELEEKLKVVIIELEDLKTDYASYKVRAQAVLRQNQTVDHSQAEHLKEETAALTVQIETLTAQLKSAQEQCEELKTSSENERRRAAESNAEANRASQRTARLQADLTRITSLLESERNQHKLQVSTLTQCYKSQITDLETRLQKETEELKKQLTLANEATSNINMRIQDNLNRNVGQFALPVLQGKEDGSDGEMDINVTMLPREEGEGSESAPTPPLSKQYGAGGGGNRSPVSLERLLEEGVPDDEALDVASLALTPEQELADLKRKLQAQMQRVKHVTVLLAESERESARYAQMNELLKGEVRRLRDSLERAKHAYNAEYLKNVTLKFVTLPPGDERCRLVPVLQKILTLSPEETHKVTAVAKGVDPNSGRSWGSYLPWPGGTK